MTGRAGRVVTAGLLGAALGCATVKESHVEKDWGTTDATRVKRLLVVVAPPPNGDAPLGNLFAQMARSYINLKREFMVKAARTVAPQVGSPAFLARSLCGEGLEGVLWLAPEVTPEGSKVREALTGQLVRCRDGEQVWSARAEGTWNQLDTSLSEMAQSYERDFGPLMKPYIAPAFHILKPTLDTLPNPVLSDEEQVEKTESD